MLQVIELEEVRGATVLVFLGSADSAERPREPARHRHAREADELDLAVPYPDPVRLPALAVAFDVDVAVAVGAPWVNWDHETMPGVAIPALELAADVSGEQITCDVRRAIEHQSRLPFARLGPRQRLVKRLHRFAVAVFDRDVEAELVAGRR
jgi:hypothetical protein